MTTAADLVRMTRRHLQGGSREPANTLASEYLAGGTTMTMSHPIGGVVAGSIIEVEWTTYTVVAADAASRVLTVLQEDEFAPPQGHPAASRVTLRPRFPAARVIEALNVELNALSGAGTGLYRVVEVAADEDGVIEIPTAAITVLDAFDSDGVRIPASRFRVSDTATGPVFRDIHEIAPEGVVFGCAFGDLDGLPEEDVETSTGLPPTATDLPTYGAAIRLGAALELQRNLPDVQGETRRAEEVPAQAYGSGLRLIQITQQQRITQEAIRLQARYGIKRRVSV